VLSGNDSIFSPEVFATDVKLLLIEDSPLLQIRLRRFLEASGSIQVADIVDSAPTAMESIDRAVFDVLIVDVELKKGSGIEVVRHARSHYPIDRQPLIIVLTNYALPVVEMRCRQAGADHFLDKMRQFSDLLPLIRQWRQPPPAAAG
jgi:CheY-like chemotaxis protein